jgi:hypothetical protein
MPTRAVREIFEGQRLIIECEFRKRGVPTDPIGVQCIVRKPSGSQAALNYPDINLTRRELGIFEANITVDEGGTWWVRFEGFGTVDAVQESSFEVRSTVMSS